MNYSESVSTVKRLQDKILLVLFHFPGGIARKELMETSQVEGVKLEKLEVFENHFRLALTSLKIRGIVRSLPDGKVQLVKQF